ncbi:MarR family winged helix-turn-helix transcriptional regulator [Mycobacterium sp. 236(2023)]|uniref:MarR family winged helix-turn-helix transcriptional regulator n=1 Tax=Mycobacterium sp. 236(2023) TaxID=3038163 RepID=UPI003241DCB7
MADDVALLIADVYELAGALRRIGETTAAAEGQTQARWQLLSVVSENPETVPRAARRLGVTRQAVQRVANELVDGGLAEFRTNPDHRTSPLLTLTPAGQKTLGAINDRARAHHRSVRRDIGDDEIRTARSVVRSLLRSLPQ